MQDDIFDLSSKLRLTCMRISRRIRASSEEQLPQSSYAVLVELDERGPHTLGELAEREGVAAPVMTRNVTQLEKSGYVTRTADTKDKRQVQVVITSEGAALKQLVKNNRDQWMAHRISTLAPDERSLLRAAATLLERIERM